jgi:hypothetical protein
MNSTRLPTFGRGNGDRLLFGRFIKNQPVPFSGCNLIKDLFESRTTLKLSWPQGKPLLDLDQFIDLSIVNEVLKEMGRKPAAK